MHLLIISFHREKTVSVITGSLMGFPSELAAVNHVEHHLIKLR